MGSTSDLHPGLVIRFNHELYTVLSFEHRTPGNLRAFFQVKMRGLKNGRILENRFRSGEEIEVVRLEERMHQYLYADGVNRVFMDAATFEQISLPPEVCGRGAHFLTESMTVGILFHDNVPIQLELPPHVQLRVVSTPPGFRGDTVSAATKPAHLESGVEVQVPLFIREGDVVSIDTRSGLYVERVKG